MTNYPSIDRLAELQQMIADFAKVHRAVPLANTNNAETDVEHSYGLAITCWFLHPKIAPDLELGKILQYALAHDIVELHAGDTYVFDAEAVATKDKRERDAIDLLRSDWSDFIDLTDHAEGYANKIDEEAKFVYAVDKILPIIMIELADAKAIWKQKGITIDMERENKKSILKSDYVAHYYSILLEWLDSRGNMHVS